MQQNQSPTAVAAAAAAANNELMRRSQISTSSLQDHSEGQLENVGNTAVKLTNSSVRKSI